MSAGAARGASVGVVAFEMEGEPTGVGRYLEGLLGGLAELDPETRGDWTLFFKGEPFASPLFSGPDAPFDAVFDRRPDARPIVWEQLRLPRLLRRHRRQRGLDLVFSPSYSLPPTLGVPAVVTIHDLSFERLPEAFPRKERWRRRTLARRAARRAARVLADTEAIADEVAGTYRIPRDKVGVVPLAVDRKFTNGDNGDNGETAERDAAALATLIPALDGPFLLVLGTVLARRRPDLALAAFAAVADAHPALRLVFAGRNRLRRPAELDALIDGSGVAERVMQLDYVPEAVLPALYRRARASLYLSSYEGYGLPPLESLACGTPALVAPGLGLDDLWPDYPYRCPELERDAVIATLEDLLADDARRRRIGREGAARMAALDWRGCAERLLDEIDRARSAPCPA